MPPQAIVPVLQGEIKGKKWIVGSSTHGCWLGSYEYQKQLLFANTIKENSIVFDVGANVGFYTLLASSLVGPAGKVFAFEPVPRNCAYLKKHLRLNHIKNVTLFEVAVADSKGMTSFDASTDNSMGHFSEQGKLQVNTVCLDDLVTEGRILAPDYIKIDVEGAEMMVLSGASAILGKYHPTLFLATHGEDIHQQCCQFLVSLGYQLVPLDGKPITKCDELLARYQ